MELKEAILKRCSVRRYKADPIDLEELKEMINLAFRAPSGSNSQPWDFIVVSDEILRKEVADLVVSAHHEYWSKARVEHHEGPVLENMLKMYKGMANVPAFVVFCRNDNRNKTMEQEYDKYRLLWADQSVAAAITIFMLLCAEKGLGTCWLGTPMWRDKELKKLLAIPQGVEVVGVTPVGYPASEGGRRPRLASQEVIHENRW